jgi:phenylalanyl-tRNA synthetase beta chain
MLMLGPKAAGYSIRRGSDPAFLDGRCAEVVLADGHVVGMFGTVHPEVLGNFGLQYPSSAADLDLQAFV